MPKMSVVWQGQKNLKFLLGAFGKIGALDFLQAQKSWVRASRSIPDHGLSEDPHPRHTSHTHQGQLSSPGLCSAPSALVL